MADRGLVIGARIATGLMAAGVAAVTIAVVGLVPLPTTQATPRGLTIEPAPAAQVRVCPGAAVRLGDEFGEAADSIFTIGGVVPAADVVGGSLERERLTSADPDASPEAAPELLQLAGNGDVLIGGAQTQEVDVPDFRGLTAASCTEPSASIWLVGGATTVGRSTLLLLSNPTIVDSRVTVEIFTEKGRVAAPGMTGIDVPAGGQRVLSLAGFAPGVTSPIVHVTARGGRVTADLQQAIVRGLDSVGVELIGAGAEPSTVLIVPGVRISDAVGTSRSSALSDWQDVLPIVRVGVPGDADATVTVRVVAQGGEASGTSFEIEVPAGTVTDVALDAGDSGDEHTHGLVDGSYTVFVEADVPVVTAVRASTSVDTGDAASEGEEGATPPTSLLQAPPSDLAWFAAAPALTGAAVVVIPEGPNPAMTIVNPTDASAQLELTVRSGEGEPGLVTVPAGAAVTFPVEAGSYLVSGSEGLSISVSYADDGMLAAFVISPARPVAGSIVIRP